MRGVYGCFRGLGVFVLTFTCLIACLIAWFLLLDFVFCGLFCDFIFCDFIFCGFALLDSFLRFVLL